MIRRGRQNKKDPLVHSTRDASFKIPATNCTHRAEIFYMQVLAKTLDYVHNNTSSRIIDTDG